MLPRAHFVKYCAICFKPATPTKAYSIVTCGLCSRPSTPHATCVEAMENERIVWVPDGADTRALRKERRYTWYAYSCHFCNPED